MTWTLNLKNWNAETERDTLTGEYFIPQNFDFLNVFFLTRLMKKCECLQFHETKTEGIVKLCSFLFYYFKGPVCNFQGSLFTEYGRN